MAAAPPPDDKLIGEAQVMCTVYIARAVYAVSPEDLEKWIEAKIHNKHHAGLDTVGILLEDDCINLESVDLKLLLKNIRGSRG